MCNPSHDGLHHDDDTISLCVSVTVEYKSRSAGFGKRGVVLTQLAVMTQIRDISEGSRSGESRRLLTG